MTDATTKRLLPPVGSEASTRRWRLRAVVDVAVRHAIAVGGIGVIAAVTLIFVYLLSVVLPLFVPASAEPVADYAPPGGDPDRTLHLAIEEQAQVGMRLGSNGIVTFFSLADGAIRHQARLPLGPSSRITAVAPGPLDGGLLAVGLDDGRALVLRQVYEETYPDDRRRIEPGLDYPFGAVPVALEPGGAPLERLALRADADTASLAAVTADGRLLAVRLAREQGLLDEEVTVEVERAAVAGGAAHDFLHLGAGQRWLFAVSADGAADVYDLADLAAPRLAQGAVALVPEGVRVTATALLLGGNSLLVGDERGALAQWFLVRGEDNRHRLERVRDLASMGAAVVAIAPEHRRKGFLAADAEGAAAVYHATSERRLLQRAVAEGPVTALAVSPRGDALLAEAAGGLQAWRLRNEHPEVSTGSLWRPVWYEGYAEPRHIWQSSAATNDFEPKFGLVPLTFGTLKAAFYAMLLAMPLAILGAVYTAYFMSAGMRRAIKPTIEIMEALPTVILGFLAGLWLAPALERHLPGVFALLLVVPLAVLAFAYLWHHLPRALRRRVPEGWHVALLLPVVVAAGWASLAASPALEDVLFGGDMRRWLTVEAGIDFDQRNAIVVGLAMGFAVIPTIFSIAEDAVFAVPRHLVHGSLALGATAWQTLVRVVLPTASPAIFSAVMMGFGRAVGETMIVLMATGNTPVMDLSIFEGMRTLSANIAVEMPESEVGSTHYRVLFLTALVLFTFTFVLNTGAELIRQRLRRRYATL